MKIEMKYTVLHYTTIFVLVKVLQAQSVTFLCKNSIGLCVLQKAMVMVACRLLSFIAAQSPFKRHRTLFLHLHGHNRIRYQVVVYHHDKYIQIRTWVSGKRHRRQCFQCISFCIFSYIPYQDLKSSVPDIAVKPCT